MMQNRYAALAGLRILVVEDETLLAMLIEDSLQRLRCELVGPVSRLDAAIAAARREELDGALLDANLCGHAVTPAAEVLAIRAVPFIIVSGYGGAASDAPVIRAAPRVGKPFTHDQLAAVMMAAFAARFVTGRSDAVQVAGCRSSLVRRALRTVSFRLRS